MRSYDEKFRRPVLQMREPEGLSLAKVAKRFGISKQTVYYWTKRLLEKKTRQRLPTKLCLEALRHDVEAHPDAYPYERAKRLSVSQNSIWRGLQRLGASYKKNPQAPQSRSRKAFYFLPKDS
jgi:transposase